MADVSVLDGTVDEVLAEVDTQPGLSAADLEELIAAEEAGANRVTLIRSLNERLDDMLVAENAASEPAVEVAPLAAPEARASVTPTSFTVTKACEIEGVAYARGATISVAVAKTIRKLDLLLSNRTLVPAPEPHHRKTDLYGFGVAPRKHPTPTHLSPVERAAL